MALTSIDHYLLQTENLSSTRDWYVRILGMTEGPHPDFKFPVCWLYIKDKDVLHIAEGGKAVSENRLKYLGQESQDIRGSGVIDHIAYAATGLSETIQHLNAEGVEYTKRQVDLESSFQLFLKGPDGVKIELNFDVAEAEGVEPTLLASDLSSES